MPSKYPNRTPVASFGPELYSLLLKASMERIEVPFPTWALGLRCQQRIHMLRAAMKREEHSDYLIVSRVRTSLVWGSKAGLAEVPNKRIKNTVIPADRQTPAKLILQPQDSEFNAIIRKAGIEVPSLEPIVEPEPKRKRISAPLPEHPTLDDILNSIKEV